MQNKSNQETNTVAEIMQEDENNIFDLLQNMWL